ncbi:hypothetical protein EYF80_010994 [Liparis tanakae]|uniref:Uncharacterized protein n=1 Tax=Liparis tanakae TaxID=230148 RepID=A0A4Z2IMW7_9TELE|nr:hypothetical protein EYF80_010994 [Liparis tanakae]
MHSRESITSSRLVSEGPLFSRCPPAANTIIRFSQVLVRLAMVLKAARLQMKQYMGEWRFLLRMTATTTSRFSARLTTPMVKKRGTGTFTSGQSEWFPPAALIFTSGAPIAALCTAPVAPAAWRSSSGRQRLAKDIGIAGQRSSKNPDWEHFDCSSTALNMSTASHR